MSNDAPPTVTIIGCGTPTPTPEAFGSSHLVEMPSGEKLLFDCGPATTHKLAKAGVPVTDIHTVIFTHHHFDHDSDFPTFVLSRWDQLVPTDIPLQVYGPPPTAKFCRGILDEPDGLFAHDWIARVNHPGSQVTFADRGGVLPRQKPVVVPHEIGAGVFLDTYGVGETDEYRVTAARAEHVQPYLDSLAYRVDTDGGSVVITGDTRPCDSVTDLARGADTLLMMCWESHERVSSTDHDLATCSILGAAETAAEAGVRQLVMVHIGARLRNPEMAEARAREAESAFDGEIVWGEELMRVPPPAP
ncbi:MAG: MBL fold metallo-hydrolase [Chloroflexi bacterium]|nr:MBL fold metallo-hydrolase [Chloroflexota bacterium]